MNDQSFQKHRNARGLFPDLFSPAEDSGENTVAPAQKKSVNLPVAFREQKQRGSIAPPPPPDISWLKDKRLEEADLMIDTDIPLSLVMVKNDLQFDLVSAALGDIGYHVERAQLASEGLEKMKTFSFSTIVMHVDFDDDPIEFNPVHSYLADLNMGMRRLIYYVLVGPDLTTCYDLEALSLSTNLVVNDIHLSSFPAILRKGLREYEELFGPYIDLLGQ